MLLAAALVATVALSAEAAWECPEAAVTQAACGQASCSDEIISSADALTALKAAVGSAYCAACRCDVNASGSTTATDAATILRNAVGQPAELTCPACNSLTLHVVEDKAAGGSRGTAADGGAVIERTDSGAAIFYPHLYTILSTTLLPDGRTAIVARNKFAPPQIHLVLFDAMGVELYNLILFNSANTNGKMDCSVGSQSCVIFWKPFGGYGEQSLLVTVVDVDLPEDRQLILVKQVEEEGEGDIEISTGAAGFTFACDPGGICVVAWALHRTTVEDQDAEYSEAFGFHARAIHMRTGEVGPELFLDPSYLYDFSRPEIAIVGGNRFQITTSAGVRVVEVR